jgi:hypothetical protein
MQKPINPSTSRTAPATIIQSGYSIAESMLIGGNRTSSYLHPNLVLELFLTAERARARSFEHHLQPHYWLYLIARAASDSPLERLRHVTNGVSINALTRLRYSIVSKQPARSIRGESCNKSRPFCRRFPHVGVILTTAIAIIAIVRKIPRLPFREYSGSDLSLLPEKNMRNPTRASGERGSQPRLNPNLMVPAFF